MPFSYFISDIKDFSSKAKSVSLFVQNLINLVMILIKFENYFVGWAHLLSNQKQGKKFYADYRARSTWASTLGDG